MTSVCRAIIPLTRNYSSIIRQRVRHTTLRPLIGPARPHDEKPARRRRLSELLQWQLLTRGAPHIWELRASCSLVPFSSLLSSRLACEARPSAKYPPARAVNNKHCLRSVSLALSIDSCTHWPSAPPVTSLSCHQCLPRPPYHTSMAFPPVTGRLTPRPYHLPCPARQASKPWKHVKAKASCSRPPHVVANGGWGQTQYGPA